MTEARAPARIPIRRLLLVLALVFVALTAGLLWLVKAERDNAVALAHAEQQRHASYQAAIELMQTSNDLTRMARLHVSTGDASYAQHYRRILDIRAGRAPRPQDYDPFYWDRVLAGTQTLDDTSAPRALAEILRELNFTPEELAALTAAAAESESLARAEEIAMVSIAAKAAARGDDGVLDNAVELEAMVGAEYQNAKGRIMAGIEKCLRLMDARTQQAVAVLAAEGRALRNALLACALVELLLVFALVALIALHILRPANALVEAAQAVEREDYGTRVPAQRTTEFDRLAQAFNQMTAAIRRDIERRMANELELAQARDAAEAATRAKSVFLATMSHEIRTPMIGVTGMLEVLSYSQLDADQRREVAVIQQSAQSLLTIIADILDFSKIEAGRLEITPLPIALRSVVDATTQNFLPAASSVGLRLVVAFDPALAAAHLADPVRLRQILSNFLSNALKFTQEGGIEVAVRVESQTEDAQQVLFSVKDSGIGISEEAQSRLFQPFQQADSGTTRKYGGTGLGLTIARRLAELMGGSITMQSAPGVGTTMFLRLPLPLADPAQIEAASASTVGVTRAKPPTREAAIAENSLLLFAEDHGTNRLVLGRQFDLAGFWVDVVEDGAKALERWKTGEYAVVFTDLHMPVMDGLELTREIRRIEQASARRRTPVLALTAAAMQEDRERCMDAGMDDVIIKPTTVPVLAGKLRQWLPELRWDAPDVAASAAPQPIIAAAAEDEIDRGVLNELAGGDAQMAREILEDFIGSTQADVQRLSELLMARDAVGVARQAHRVKGAARMVGARTLASLGEQLEAAGGIADWPEIGRLIPQIVECFGRLRAA